MWGNYPQDLVAFGSVLLARYEMAQIDQVKWRRKNVARDPISLKEVWNSNLSQFYNIQSHSLQEFCQNIFSEIYGGAVFPFKEVFKACLTHQGENIMIKANNYDAFSQKSRACSEKAGMIYHRRPIQIQNMKLPDIIQ